MRINGLGTDLLTRAAKADKTRKTENGAVSEGSGKRDVFQPSAVEEATPEKPLRTLSSTECKELAANYNIKDMTYDQRSDFLQELNRAGVISDNDFWVLKYGAVPCKEHSKPQVYVLPKGASESENAPEQIRGTNWLKNYSSIHQYLEDQIKDEDSERIYGKYGDIYSRFLDIMNQIEEA